MDTTLVRTFLAVVATGSFVNAAGRLYVTQSAISLRVQKLEDELGHKLFERDKSGAALTPHGREFEPYARSFLQIWEEARYKIGVPDGFDSSLSVGCQASLWPELTSVWLHRMEQEMPQVAFQIQVGSPTYLQRQLLSGLMDIVVVYQPEMRPGFEVEQLLDDRLVMVTADESAACTATDEHYIYVDWGSEFAVAHGRWFPEFRLSRLSMEAGGQIADYLVNHKRAAYLPYRVADDYILAGRLHIVKDAPDFPFPAYAVWTSHKEDNLIEPALETLRKAAKDAPLITHL